MTSKPLSRRSSPARHLPSITRPPSPAAGAASIAVALAIALAAQQPRGYTNDFAGVLSRQAVERLDRLAGEVERKTGAQIAIVIIRTLNGRPIEDYSIDLARRWGIGGKKDDRGVLLLLVVDDRRSRLEVGYGLEPILPDGRAGAILRSMRPDLRAGRYDEALWRAVGQIANIIAESSGVTLEDPTLPRPPPPSGPAQGLPSLPLWVLALGAAGVLWLVWKVGLGPLWWLSGMRGWGGFTGRGGDYGSSGWDGGGFSGFGGGDFGGGGASSDW